MEFLKYIVFLGLVVAIFCFFTGCTTLKPIKGSENYFIEGKKIVFSQSGSTFILGKTVIEKADINSFEPLSDFFAKDKNHVYWRGFVIPQADPKTVELIKDENTNNWSKRYIKDKNHVFYETNIVKGADPKTISVTFSMAQDKFSYYDNGKKYGSK